MTVEAQRATIQTATVTIRALKIDNRQMTKAVYRQLPSQDILDWATFRFRCEPWGWVNEHTNCLTPVPHLHVVYDEDGELFVSNVRVDDLDPNGVGVVLGASLSTAYALYDESAAAIHAVRSIHKDDGIIPAPPPYLLGTPWVGRPHRDLVSTFQSAFKEEGYTADSRDPDAVWRVLEWDTAPPEADKVIKHLKRRMESLYDEVLAPAVVAWDALQVELHALPQLFISA